MGNKTSEYTLLKSRGTGSIITSGFRLYTENIKKIFKASWHTALAYALACAVMGPLLTVKLPLALTERMQGGATASEVAPAGLILLIVAVLFTCIAGGVFEAAFYSCGISRLRHHRDTGTILSPAKWLTFDLKTAWRTLKAALLCGTIAAVPAIALGVFWHLRLDAMLNEPSAHIITLSLTAVAVCILAVLMLPLAPISMKYVLNDGTRLMPLIAKDYSTYLLRHTASVLATLLAGGIIVTAAGYITALPVYIIVTANRLNSLGMLNGDPSGMPSYITALTAMAFLIVGFLQAYIRMSVIFIVYYLHGSIETDENARREMAEKTQPTETENQTL